MKNYQAALMAGCSVFVFSVGGAVAAQAQTAAPAADQGSLLSDVVVTARKVNEKLLDIPIAVTAFSAQSLQTVGITSMTELAQFTPSMTDNNTLGGSGRSDRSFPQYIIRGITPSTTLNPTTTVFVDGAPLASGQAEGLDDLERVEVLKGPQSAYFGRETFAGAINLVTKDPSATPSATINALVGGPAYYDERVSLEGPIIGDKLTGRVSYRYYDRQGSYTNGAAADKSASHLGNQDTQSVNFELVAKPIENLKIKALGMYWHDSDGPSAQAFIGSIPGSSQSNCTTAAGPWFCGTAPGRAANQPASNDIVDGPIAAFLKTAGSPAGLQLTAPPSKYGLVRDAYHGSVGIEYYAPSIGVTFNSLSGVDNQIFSELQDLDNADGSAIANPYLLFGGPYGQTFYNNPFLVEEAQRDFSQEFRATSNQDQRFRWIVGASYTWNRVDSSLAGAGSFSYFVPDTPTASTTTAIFYGLTLDVFKQLTISFEGRYQSDKQTTVNNVSGAFNDFLPRVIAQYKFTPDVMAYATFSEGVNPGVFNTTSGVQGLTAADQANFTQVYGYSVIVRPEHLDNYELGLKGRFFDNRLSLSADAYYDIWTDQINQVTAVYIESGATKLVSASANNGKVIASGIEGDFTFRPVSHVDFNMSGSINDTNIRSGTCITCDQITGKALSTVYSGNQLPNVSKYQTAIGLEYSNTLSSAPGWDWFGRVDYSYKSGSYASQDNLVKTPDSNTVNFRMGLNHKALRIEGFVQNAFNNGAYTNLATFYNVNSPLDTYARPDALVGGLPQLRTYGVRLRYKFGA